MPSPEVRTRLHDLARGLPPSVWALHAGMAVHTVGSGFIAPFLVIYLHDVRGLEIETAGLAVGAHFAVSIVFGLVAGPVVDAVGARAVTAAALVIVGAGMGSMPLVEDATAAFVVLSAAGVGRGAFWPAYSAMLAALTPPDRMHVSYAVQRVTGNFGFGVGGLAAGLIATTSDPRTFEALFVVSLAASLVFAIVVLLLPHVPPRPEEESTAAATGYRDVLRDRAFVGAVALAAVFATVGVSQLNTMLPAYAKDEGVSETGIGLLFFVNTLTIVVAQLPVAARVEGRRRMRLLAVVGCLWAACWLGTLAAGLWLPSLALAAALVAVAVVFALGECLDGVTWGPLVAELAPQRVRGRYMAVWLVSAQLGLALGPALGGVLLAQSPIALWLAAAATCLVAGASALMLERRLPDTARRARVRPAPSPAA
jgi:MFS family permease